jgi:hypothetical protein
MHVSKQIKKRERGAANENVKKKYTHIFLFSHHRHTYALLAHIDTHTGRGRIQKRKKKDSKKHTYSSFTKKQTHNDDDEKSNCEVVESFQMKN